MDMLNVREGRVNLVRNLSTMSQLVPVFPNDYTAIFRETSVFIVIFPSCFFIQTISFLVKIISNVHIWMVTITRTR